MFPVQFPRIPMVSEERFYLIVKKTFPEKLKLRVLQQHGKVPYREGIQALRPLHTSIDSAQSETRTSQPRTFRQRDNELRLSHEYDGHVRDGSLAREKTYYPRGWPRTKTRVKRLRRVKICFAEDSDDANYDDVIKMEARQSNNVLNDKGSGVNKANKETGSEGMTYASTAQDIATREKPTRSELQSIPTNEESSILPAADTSVEYPQDFEVGGNATTRLSINQQYDTCSQRTADKLSNYLNPRQEGVMTLPPIESVAVKSTTNTDGLNTATKSQNQHRNRSIQTTLPALPTKYNQKVKVNKSSQQSRKSGSKSSSHVTLPRIKRPKNKQTSKNNEDLEITNRKPVLSSFVQLQDLVQSEAPGLGGVKAVDPYSIYLKYHGRKQVIDCGTYHRHARKGGTRRLAESD